MSTRVHCNIYDGRLVCLCVRSCVGLVGCVCKLACDVGDNEM